eukprot:scaffold36024_cov75-Phaeocystis_antarctica.AAC.4
MSTPIAARLRTVRAHQGRPLTAVVPRSSEQGSVRRAGQGRSSLRRGLRYGGEASRIPSSVGKKGCSVPFFMWGLENRGFDPRTSRMLNGRSAN